MEEKESGLLWLVKYEGQGWIDGIGAEPDHKRTCKDMLKSLNSILKVFGFEISRKIDSLGYWRGY